ncbi:hypothetical protein RD110_07985 [Rhodoferax koreense]|uniref:Cro/Cl family transcriptional regulator n=1 Tax=Rhodoferax koreensis TaxID=1842727 RepID=A0A1P8JTS5_9BURK|nr:Cro/CI family transcriptional regulator [Rhodoferax koreense]APW37143.1 hypothetical protein RD110_07985 [Rhodoferax koreense]
MKKQKAIELLGGVHATAKAVGVTYQAVKKWPEELTDRIEDRIWAVMARKHLPRKLRLELTADARQEA